MLDPGRTHARLYNTSAPHSSSFLAQNLLLGLVVLVPTFMTLAFGIDMIEPSALWLII